MEKKYIISILLIIIGGLLITFAIASPNDPSRFGNLTVTTCWVGGSAGIVNCTGNAIFDGDVTASNFYGIFHGNSSIWSRAGTFIFPTNIGDYVGIGTLSPDDELDIEAAHSQLRLTDSDDSSYTQFSSSGSIFVIRTDSTSEIPPFVIDASDEVGIGILNPTEKLEVNGSIFMTNDNDKMLFGAAKDASIYYNGTHLFIDTQEVGSGDLIIPNGNVRIGGDAYIAGTIINTDFTTLSDNSMADTLHRHSELSAADGTPDAVVAVNNDGLIGMGGVGIVGSRLTLHAGDLRLDETGTTTRAVRWSESSTTRALINYDFVNNRFTFNSAEANSDIILTPNRKVGINTISPDELLDVDKNQNAATYVKVQNANAGTSSQVGFRATADSTETFLLAHADARITTRYGIAIGGYSELLGGGTPIGLLIGTGTTNVPIIFGNNNVERMRIDAGGNVGIGTASPLKRLDVQIPLAAVDGIVLSMGNNSEDQSPRLFFFNGTEQGNSIMRSDNRLIFNVGATTSSSGNAKMVLQDDGNVGIGTSSPDEELEVSVASGVATIQINSATSDSIIKFSQGGTEAWTIGKDTSESNAFVFAEGDGLATTPRVTFDVGGNVGIGTSSPLAELEIDAGTNKSIQIGSTAGLYTTNTFFTDLTSLGSVINLKRESDGEYRGSIFTYTGTGQNLGIAARSDIVFATNAGEIMRLEDGGQVGIGTSSPQNLLNVVSTTDHSIINITAGASKSASLRLVNDAQDWDVNIQTNDNFAIYDQTGGKQTFTIEPGTLDNTLYLDSTGVGIGTVSPNDRLEIAGNTIIRNAENNPALIISPSNAGYGVDPELVMQSAETGIGTGANFHISMNALFRTSDDTYQYIDDVGVEASKVEFESDGDLKFSYAAAGTGAVTWTDIMFIEGSTGEVGIGTSGPQAPLHIDNNYAAPTGGLHAQGDLLLSRMDNAIYIQMLAGTANAMGIRFGDVDDADTGIFGFQNGANDFFFLGGNVGIGTAGPNTKLEVAGDIRFTGNDLQSGTFGTDSKRAIINLEVKEDTTPCSWEVSACANPGSHDYPSCDLGEFTGDTSYVLTGNACNGVNEGQCIAIVYSRTYKACLDLQIGT